jgi:hypothetical protein
MEDAQTALPTHSWKGPISLGNPRVLPRASVTYIELTISDLDDDVT